MTDRLISAVVLAVKKSDAVRAAQLTAARGDGMTGPTASAFAGTYSGVMTYADDNSTTNA